MSNSCQKNQSRTFTFYNRCINKAFSYVIPLLTYVIIDETIDRNDFQSQVRYEGNGLTEKQVFGTLLANFQWKQHT